MDSTGSNFPNTTKQFSPQARTGRLCPTCSLHVSDDMKVCPNDGTALAVNYSPKIISNLAGQYEFLGKIGEGGMGVIYKAKHIGLNQMVAIKMLHVNRLDDNKVLRFQQEAKAVSALDHPSIVRVRDFGISESGQPHMVLDFIDGVTLEQFIKTQGPLSVRDARDIFVQICDAIGHAHQRNVLHRDLKPSNIMLVYRDNECPLVKIVDFGIAKVTDPDREQGMSLTRTGEVFGSPFYMSPEQTAGKELDKRSDIYSVGCVLFESLTGTPPFVGQNAIETLIKHTSEAPPSLKEASLGKAFPAELQTVVNTVLAKDPAARYQDMQSFKSALVNAFDNLGKTESKKTDADKNQRFPTRKQVVAITSVIALVGMALGATYLARRMAPDVVSSVKTDEPVTAGNASATGSVPGAVSSVSTGAAITTASAGNDTGALPFASTGGEPPSMAQILNPDSIAKMMIFRQKNNDTIRVAAWCSDQVLACFDDVTAAREVYLNETAIEGPGLEHLVKLPITALSLRGGINFKNDGLSYVVMMKDLDYLDLSRTKVDDDGMEYVRTLQKLKSLNLDSDAITGKGLAKLTSLKLHSLSIQGCSQIQDDDLRFVAKMQKLETLNLEADDVTDKGLRVLTSAGSIPLTSLSLEQTKVTDDGLKYLKAFPSLREISLAHTGVTAAGLRTLFSDCPRISRLNLNDAKSFHESGLSVLQGAPALETLGLDGFKVTHDGMKALTKLHLKTLSIGRTDFDDQDLATFIDMPSLKLLNLTGTKKVTKAGAEKFMAVRPDCTLLRNRDEAVRAHLPGYNTPIGGIDRGERGDRGGERHHHRQWTRNEFGRMFR